MARAKRRRAASEIEFNLEHVRYIRRLARRIVKQLTLMESFLKKAKKWDAKATPEEIAAAFEAYEPPNADDVHDRITRRKE